MSPSQVVRSRAVVRPLRAAALGLLCGLMHACASAPPRAREAQSEAALDPQLALVTFDSAWSRIANTHYDLDYNGVDWRGVREELRPRAAVAATLPQLRAVLNDMLGRLGESHYGIIPGDVVDAVGDHASLPDDVAGDAGLEVRVVDDQLLVWRVATAGPAARAGIGTGWQITHIDGRASADRINAIKKLPAGQRRTAHTRMLYQANAELAGAPGSQVTLTLRDGRGRSLERTLERQARSGELVRFANMPPTMTHLEQERIVVANGCVGVIRFNVWLGGLVPKFDEAVDAVRGCRGVIIDLRGNPGGVSGMVMGTAGHFLNDTLPLGFMRSRNAPQLRFKANPRRVRSDGTPVEPFAGSLAILVDEMTASTSEFFAAGMQGVGRARVFGTPSAGQALPALLLRLPTGDVLMHVIADFTGPRSVRIEGRGVIPDVPIASSRADLLQGRDAPLLAALEWIASGAAAGH